LDQAIVEFFGPFAGEEGDDRGAALEKFRAVAPAAVLGIGQRHAFGIARIPGVLRHAGLLGGGLLREWRQRRTRHETSPLNSSPDSIVAFQSVDGPTPIGR